jgi:polar amino acid transport system substrate-binding protein
LRDVSLPWASKTGAVPGLQIELAENLAMRLGVTLTRQWVVSAIQYRRADCDIVLDVISNKGSSVEFGLRLSRPYQRSSVVLAVRNTPGARITARKGGGGRSGALKR